MKRFLSIVSMVCVLGMASLAQAEALPSWDHTFNYTFTWDSPNPTVAPPSVTHSADHVPGSLDPATAEFFHGTDATWNFIADNFYGTHNATLTAEFTFTNGIETVNIMQSFNLLFETMEEYNNLTFTETTPSGAQDGQVTIGADTFWFGMNADFNEDYFENLGDLEYQAFAFTDGLELIFTAYAETDYNAPEPTPEPATMLLMGAGLAGLGFVRRRKNT